MSYWVYENWTIDKAIVHKGDCPYCKDGKGIHPNKEEGRNGKWHGPFDVLAYAGNVAASLNKNARECKFCLQ